VYIQHRPNHTQTEPASQHHPDQPVQPDHTRLGHYLTPNPHPSRVSHVRTVEPLPISPNRATAASQLKSLVLPIGVTTGVQPLSPSTHRRDPPDMGLVSVYGNDVNARADRGRSSFSPPDRRCWSSFSSTPRCPDATPSRSRPCLIDAALSRSRLRLTDIVSSRLRPHFDRRCAVDRRVSPHMRRGS
jgi:hypothetical protein